MATTTLTTISARRCVARAGGTPSLSRGRVGELARRPRLADAERRRASANASSNETDLPEIVPEPSFNVPLGFLGLSGVAALGHATPVAGLFGVLAAFLAFQATRVKFCFDDTGLEVLVGEEKRESENAFVGGRNRWSYDSFVNWEFWFPGFPILVYFKETQTKPEGQIHFFPIIFDGKQLYDVMVERCGASQTSAPEED